MRAREDLLLVFVQAAEAFGGAFFAFVVFAFVEQVHAGMNATSEAVESVKDGNHHEDGARNDR